MFVQIAARAIGAFGIVFGAIGFLVSLAAANQIVAIVSLAAIALGTLCGCADAAIEYLARVAAASERSAEALEKLTQSRKSAAK